MDVAYFERQLESLKPELTRAAPEHAAVYQATQEQWSKVDELMIMLIGALAEGRIPSWQLQEWAKKLGPFLPMI